MASAANSDNGLFGGMGDKISGVFDKLFAWPDKPKTPAGRKAARIGFNILVMALGAAVFCFVVGKLNPMTGQFNLPALTNPSITTLMIAPLTVVVAGHGLANVIEEAVGQKHRRTAAKVMAVLLPMVLFVGSAALIASGFVGGTSPLTAGNYSLIGFILLPLSFYALDHSCKVLGNSNVQIVSRRARQQSIKLKPLSKSAHT